MGEFSWVAKKLSGRKNASPVEKEKGEKGYLQPPNGLKLAKGASKACPKVGEGYEEWVSQCRLSS
jgi:hypothetical protein